MLARSFLSAAELGISEVEKDALVKVLHVLERRELVHSDCGNIPNAFNMATWGCQSATFVSNGAAIFAHTRWDDVLAGSGI